MYLNFLCLITQGSTLPESCLQSLVKQFIDLIQGKRLVKDDLRQSAAIIKELAEETKKGRRFIIFPEGGYYKNHNTVGEFKAGSFKSAVKAKVPIIPVALVENIRVLF
mgnify:CR=1 FL=1